MILSSVSIVSEWHTILPGATEGRSAIFEAVADRLAEMDAPEIMWAVERVSAGIIKSLLGRGRDYLVITFHGFPEHRALIGCESFGTTVGLSLLVVAQVRLGRSLRRAIVSRGDAAKTEEVGGELGIGAATRLSTLISIVRLALDDALNSLFGANPSGRRPATYPSDFRDPLDDE